MPNWCVATYCSNAGEDGDLLGDDAESEERISFARLSVTGQGVKQNMIFQNIYQ